MFRDLNPADAGYVTGQLMVWLALFAGVLKCWSISRRPTTNRKCALALMFILLAFVLAGCVGVLARILGKSPEFTVVTGLVGLVVLGLFVTSLVLAILGLIEFSNRPDAFSQGRAQAIWALVLTGLLGLTFGAGFVTAVARPSRFALASSSPGQTLTFDDLNFRLRAPERPWVSIDASKLNKDSKVTFIRRFPEAYFFVIAEKIGTSVNWSSEQLAELTKGQMQAAATSTRVTSEAPLVMNGLRGVLVETEATVAMHPLHYLRWCCATNGYAYQLIGYSRSEDQQRINAELRQMFLRFELVDPNRVASVGGFATNYVSPRYGYSVNVANSPWHTFSSLEQSMPLAEFGASQGDSCFVVVPAFLGGEKLQRQALSSALLATMNVAYPNENLMNRKALWEEDLGGEQFDFEREVEGHTYRYRFKILQGGGVGYLVAAWTLRRAVDVEATLTDALARVRFTSRPAFPLSSSGEFTARDKKTQGLVLNQAGLFHFNSGDYEQALPLFRAAARANRQESLYVINALQAWRRLDRPKEALDFLDAQPSSISTIPAVRAQQAYFQANRSLTDQALTNYARLFAEGYRNDGSFGDYANLLMLQRQYDVALSEVEKYLKTEDSVTVRLLEAEIHRLKRDFPKAISLLKVQREKAPFNGQIANALPETCIQAGQCSEALEISKELVKNNPDSAYAHHLQGRSELGLKWYREAKVSFESAAKLAPASKDIASYLELVSGLLGEGNNTLLKEPIDIVALPAVLTNTPVDPIPVGYATSHGAYYNRRIVAVSYEPGKQYKSTDFMWARILDASGVAAFSSFQVPFDPLSEQVFVNEVRVTDSAGKTISTGKVSDYYVLDDRSGTEASQKKVLNIPVPGLQPGCQLAVIISRRQLGHLDEFPFLVHSFSCTVPVRESVLFLRGEAAGLKHVAWRGMEPQRIPEGRYWRVLDPMVACWEPQQLAAADFLPMMWVADASAHWPVLASNYIASISNCLEQEASIHDQARSLVAGLEDDARIAAIARYVQSNLTYKAIEFGRRARVPNKPADIARNKYGDCKDHAVLLEQMLEAAGVPARLALVGHRGPILKELPSLDQFDHMIVYIPEGGTGRFVDCTDKGADAAHAIPLGLAGRDALILDAQNPHFETIPSYPENASGIEVQRNLRLVDMADVVTEETVTLTGVHAAYLRDYLLQIPPASRRMLLQRQMGMTDVELSEFKAEPVDAPDAPLQLRCTYTCKKQFHRSNDQLTGTLRAGFERSYLTADPVDNRLTPFETRIPLSIRSTVSVDVPEGFRAEKTADLAPQLDARFAVCKGHIRLEGRKLKLEFQCRQPTGKSKASEYASYRDTMAQALSLLEREVVFKADTH